MIKQKLLGINTNYKTIKNQKVGVLTGIIYMAPYNLSGKNVCPNASAGCAAACLNTAGRGAMNTVQRARLKKTNRFWNNREKFLMDLAAEIGKLRKRAAAKGLKAAVRLNGTSDLPYERYTIPGTDKNIMELFPDVQFYDYTKYPNRKRLPANYHLTFSKADGNDRDAQKAIKNGLNIAVVFQNYLPKSYLGRPVIDGDKNDLRFLDGKNVVVGLLAKGKAKKDNTGFVVKQGGQNE